MPSVGAVAASLRPDLDRVADVVRGERGLGGEVRARLQAGVDDVEVRRVGVDARVDADQVGADLAREHGHRAAAGRGRSRASAR